MKICSRCKECKDFTEFHRDKTPDGFAYMCKACKSVTRKARREANPEPNRERARAWYRANSARVLAMQKVKRAIINEATREQREQEKALRHAAALAKRKEMQPVYSKRYAEKHADKIKILRKERYNREENTKRLAKWREKNREAFRKYAAKWRETNAEQHARYAWEWRQRYPERAARSRAAYELRRSLGVEPPEDLIDLIVAKRKLDRAIKESKYGTK